MKIRFSLAFAAVILSACSALPTAPSEPVKVRVLAINDFHGNLLPPPGGIRIRDPQDHQKTLSVSAGGAEHLATAVRDLMAQNPNHVFVAAGDLIGASPLLSALFFDEPTIESLSMMGLEISAVGNHEFDHGLTELLRKQNGGCHPLEGCKGPTQFKGASFQYLAASTWDTRSGKTVFPAYQVKSFQGVPVAFIGLTLKGTPGIVMPSGVAGLRFDDEASTVNHLVPELKAKGIQTIVVLIHEGGVPTGDYNECPGISGAIVDIVKHLDKAVRLVISGHTHRAYNCNIDGRLVTSGDKYGTLVTSIDLELDAKTRELISAKADNVIVRTEQFAKDAAQTQLIAGYEKVAAPLINRVVGSIVETISRDANSAGASPMGELVADAQLKATAAPDQGGAQIAFMNTGGVRQALAFKSGGAVTYGDVFSVQPFNNNLITMTLSGEQIRRLLELQWRSANSHGAILYVSQGFGYTWDASKPVGSRVAVESIKLNGRPLDLKADYRVTVNAFVASGGDGFKLFTEGRSPLVGMPDVDALALYMQAHPGLKPSALDRVKRMD